MAKRRNTVRNLVIILSCCVVVAVVAVVAVGLSNPVSSAQIAWKQPPRDMYDYFKMVTLNDGNLAMTVGEDYLEIVDPAGVNIKRTALPVAVDVWNIIPAESGGVFIGTQPGGVLAYDAGGTELWDHRTASGDYTRVFLGADGLVYGITWTAMPAVPPTLVTVLKPTGELVAEFEVPIVPGRFHHFNAGPDGSIYLATDRVDTVLYSYNVDGSLNWEQVLHQHPDPGLKAFPVGEVGGIAVAGGLVVASLRGMGLKAFDAAGGPRWEYSADDLDVVPHPLHYCVDVAGDVVVATYRDDVTGLDLDGNRLWVTEVPIFINEVTVRGDAIFVEAENTSQGRNQLASKVRRVSKGMAADIWYDRMLFEFAADGTMRGEWLLPAATWLCALPNDQGRAYGVWRIEISNVDPATGKRTDHLVGINLPR